MTFGEGSGTPLQYSWPSSDTLLNVLMRSRVHGPAEHSCPERNPEQWGKPAMEATGWPPLPRGAVAGDHTPCSAYSWKHRDSWHTPRAAPHSNKPRSSCHNISPLEGAGVSVIATWYFLAAVLITSPRPSPAKKEGSWEGPKQRGLGP